jgi:hypothetical protein
LSVLTYTYLYSSFLPFPSSLSDPARSIGVDGWGVMCLIVWYLVLFYGFELVDGNRVLSVWH